ncbi:LysR substrate-binding domain-containing protein [Halomonas sp. GXIMD04776]|uniref:LysR substrate-binding domain-containing protein n=1 Tax=Halomonas sp. GXIMD04776 TaxID=3415605 RepID=UPI003CBBD89A
MPSRLPLATLRAFEAAARLSSFSAAANELHVTAAAVSHRIKALEEGIGVRLFERKPRGVALTEAGARYRDRIAEAFILIEQATSEIGQPSMEGSLRVSAPHAFLQHTLLPRIGELLHRHPGLKLTLEGDNRLANLHEDEADIAIRFGAGHYPGLQADHLMDDAITVLGPANGGPRGSMNSNWQSACFIEDSSTVISEPWSQWGPWWREAGLHAPEELRRLTVSDSGLALAACAQGLGLCLARLSVARDLIRQGAVTPQRPWRRTEFSHYLVTLPGSADTPPIPLMMRLETFSKSS